MLHEPALHDPARHEALLARDWDEGFVRAAIARIVEGTEAAFDAERYWPLHPQDAVAAEPAGSTATPFYHGAGGIIWALERLRDAGAARLHRDYDTSMAQVRERNRAWSEASGVQALPSYLMGDTPFALRAFTADPSDANADALAALVARNVDHPARELMWGAPGTMLAALFALERGGDERFAESFRASADRLWDALEWSQHHGCAYWVQMMSGARSTYLDAVHGFVSVALPLIRGRALIADRWDDWQSAIDNTVARTAVRAGALANWPPELDRDHRKTLVQLCHGAPGFVVCLASSPGHALDELLLAAGETTWVAGPLAKGSNLCHGTAGNGYAFLALHARTGDALWLARARAFAMHAIRQMEVANAQHGQLRHSLWTGDVGLALYLYDCLPGSTARFPMLDCF